MGPLLGRVQRIVGTLARGIEGVMMLNVCADPNCPNLQRVKELEREVEAMRWHLINLQRCPAFPKGERCALPVGHDGPHKWGSGD
jgi:hypothetical protein